MQRNPTISFLASHGGSSAKNIIAAIDNGDLAANVGLIITNNRDSDIHQWCQENDIAIKHISSKTHSAPDQEDLAILQALIDAGTDLVVLSGYMKKIEKRTLAHFANCIVNIHPSLLPNHGGPGMYGDRVHRAVLAAGEKQSGASVHLINEIYDDGPILAQQQVPVYDHDTVATLKSRVQNIEGEIYLKALKALVN